MDPMNDKLDQLVKAYREACPDPEPSADFMPGLWQKIEKRRASTTSVFRHIAEVFVMATIAVVVVLGAVVIPHLQSRPVYTATYVDVLAADFPNSYLDVLNGDIK
jgi:hypothetical protein